MKINDKFSIDPIYSDVKIEDGEIINPVKVGEVKTNFIWRRPALKYRIAFKILPYIPYRYRDSFKKFVVSKMINSKNRGLV